MSNYYVVFKASVRKDLKKIDSRYIHKILEKIKSLSKTPIPIGARKLQGTKSIYRIRVGVYRIIYKIEYKERKVVVFYIRHRKDVY